MNNAKPKVNDTNPTLEEIMKVIIQYREILTVNYAKSTVNYIKSTVNEKRVVLRISGFGYYSCNSSGFVSTSTISC